MIGDLSRFDTLPAAACGVAIMGLLLPLMALPAHAGAEPAKFNPDALKSLENEPPGASPFQAEVTISTSSNSNVRLEEPAGMPSKVADTAMGVMGRVSYNNEIYRSVFLSAAGSTQYKLFANSNEFSDLNFSATAGLRVDRDPVYFTLNDDVAFLSEPTEVELSAFFGMLRRLKNNMNASVGYRMNRVTAKLNYSWATSVYGGGYNFYDNDQHTFGLDVDMKVMARTSVFARYGLALTDYSQPVLNNFRTHTFGAGARGEITTQLALNGMVGVNIAEGFSGSVLIPGGGSAIDFMGTLSATWDPLPEQTRVMLSASHSLKPSSKSNYQDATFIGLDVRQRLSRTMSMGFGARGEVSQPAVGSRIATVGAYAKVSMTLNEHASVFAGLDYTTRFSDDPFGEFERYIVEVGTSITF
jgi:hypothetical protein